MAGAFRELVDGFLLINVEYTTQSGVLTKLDKLSSSLASGWGSLALWMGPVGMLAYLAAAVRRLLDRDARRRPGGMAVVGVGAGLLAGLLWCLRAYNNWPDTFPLLPYAALGFGAIALAVRERFPARVAVPAVAAWSALCLIAGLSHAISTRNHGLEEQRASVAAVLRVAPPDASILSAGSAAALVLSGRRNPTRHLTFAGDLKRYIDDTWPGGLAGYAAWVDETEPTLITVDTRDTSDWIAPVLDSKYVRVGKATSWQWYVLRSVGPRKIARLRKVIRAARCQRPDAPPNPCEKIPE